MFILKADVLADYVRKIQRDFAVIARAPQTITTLLGDKMIPLTKFYIGPPQDEYWNTGHPITIIEAQEVENIYFKELKVIAPSSFADSWPTVCKDFFMECSGPARELTYEEYVELIHKLIPSRTLPKGYKPKSTEVFHSTIEKKVTEEQKLSVKDEIPILSTSDHYLFEMMNDKYLF